MAAVDFSIGDEVSIDGNGRATIIERNLRDSGRYIYTKYDDRR